MDKSYQALIQAIKNHDLYDFISIMVIITAKPTLSISLKNWTTLFIAFQMLAQSILWAWTIAQTISATYGQRINSSALSYLT